MIIFEPNTCPSPGPSRTVIPTSAVYVHHHFTAPVVVKVHGEYAVYCKYYDECAYKTVIELWKLAPRQRVVVTGRTICTTKRLGMKFKNSILLLKYYIVRKGVQLPTADCILI